MSIFLIRHGETALNAARVLQPADTPLSARGLQQAAALAARLAGLGVVRILSSDLPRARQTADAIAAATGAPLETTPTLRERNFGDLRGRAYDALDVDPLTSEAAPPGGESRAQFERRVDAAHAEIVRLRAATDGNLAVVTHGLVLRALLGRNRPAPAHFGNTSLSVLAAEAPHAPGLVNCTRHLDTGARDDAAALSGG